MLKKQIIITLNSAEKPELIKGRHRLRLFLISPKRVL